MKGKSENPMTTDLRKSTSVSYLVLNGLLPEKKEHVCVCVFLCVYAFTFGKLENRNAAGNFMG